MAVWRQDFLSTILVSINLLKIRGLLWFRRRMVLQDGENDGATCPHHTAGVACYKAQHDFSQKDPLHSNKNVIFAVELVVSLPLILVVNYSYEKQKIANSIRELASNSAIVRK